MRKAELNRKTNETTCSVTLNLDGTGVFEVNTGVGFFDHMLAQLSKHSLIDMKIATQGDTHIDDHHTVEDTGIVLGQAIRKALGDLKGISRYADAYLPMDETLARAAVDISGRPFLVFKADFPTQKIGEFDVELVREFFQAFAMNAGITLHIEVLYGLNSHHIAEAMFKAVARTLRKAIEVDPRVANILPSTKGALG